MTATPRSAGPVDGLDRSLLSAVAVFRGVAWAWMAIVLVASNDALGRPVVASLLAAAALAVTTAGTLLLRRRPRLLLTPAFIVAELAVGALMLAGDDFIYEGEHSQSLGSAWPLAGIMLAGVAGGPVAGTVAGASLGLARWGGHVEDSALSLISTAVLYGLAGGAQGFAAQRLRRSEREVAEAKAREELARTLHDGVLQTLAIMQRRAEPDLARLAREQERELREYLYGTGQVAGAGGDLGTRLRAAAAQFEDRYEASARVVLADDLPDLAPGVVDALAGAVSEAMTNAAKHGQARTVTVYAEPVDGSVMCSVKDDGQGFDPDVVVEGAGLRSSIRGRITEVGGRVELDGRPGRGVEVRLFVPG